jgi:ribonuclease VapC
VIVDTSALVAILRREDEAVSFRTEIAKNGQAMLSSGSYLETCIVISGGRDTLTNSEVDEVIEMLGVEIVPFSKEQARLARDAYAQFGKGSGHPAQLNFGDCFAYALAKESGKALLFKGDDFAKTDVKVASA